MKEKLFMFIIGLLVGAILATGGFYIYHKNNKNVSAENNTETKTEQFEKRDGKGERMQGDFDGEEPPEMPDGEMPEFPDGGEPPAMDGNENTNSDSNSDSSSSGNRTRPTKPNKKSNTTTTNEENTTASNEADA